MIKLLKERNRFSETLFMGTISLLCFSFSIFRFIYTDTKVFLFLNWNLFLAFIPWAVTSITILKPSIQRYKVTIIILLAVWLLFFPNAPYILTDLFHLRLKSSMPKWFDLILILSFAWTGLVFGFLSLWDIEKILTKSLSQIWISIISVSLLFVGSFGIYLGRYLRWNSWDIIGEPFNLLYDITDRLINPFDHPRTWGVTIFMGIFLNMIYWTFWMVKKRE
ncbi:MAG: DUF1361 domain-containing protein [Leptospiraceae bacterium]|nr:DUF1361 domain-containing protein [Leptospiraceae bacterium]MBK9500224.1 DUF1361 domain-containing protein [Leptospiraceae bacterium]MBL0263147.1 DUF1361 domain-containing protein [Leptospiraceae bacterium]MBP9162832.1 DUF1361 domain-containing protein [Leptospiraceae bacterium]